MKYNQDGTEQRNQEADLLEIIGNPSVSRLVGCNRVLPKKNQNVKSLVSKKWEMLTASRTTDFFMSLGHFLTAFYSIIYFI